MLPVDVTPKNPNLFECNCCNYITSNKKDYNKHLLTRKHNAKVNENINESPDYIICEKCHKQYKSRVGLWQHQKKCTPIQEPVEETPIIPANIDIDLFNENKALKEFLIKQSRQINEMEESLIKQYRHIHETGESLIKQSRQIHEMKEYTDAVEQKLHYAHGFLRQSIEYYTTKFTQKPN
jgi:hypothetical protein